MSLSPAKTEQHLLDPLRRGDNEACEALYQRCYPAVERYVCRHNGTTDQARDLFQDTLLVVLAAVKKPDFVLTCSLPTYVMAISKNLWYKQLNAATRWSVLPAAAEELDWMVTPDEQPEIPTVYERVGTILTRLTARCQALLKAIFMLEKSITTIVREDGYANVHTAQNQKYKCLAQARKETRKPTRLPQR